MKSQVIIDKIQAKLDSFDPAKRTTFKIFQFNFNSADGSLLKNFVLDLKDLKVYEGTYENPDGEITISDEDFYAIATKAIEYKDLLSAGKVQLKGDLESIKKLLAKLHE